MKNGTARGNAADVAAAAAAGSVSETKTMATAVSDGKDTSKVGRSSNQTQDNASQKPAKTTSAIPELQVKMSGYLKKKRKVSLNQKTYYSSDKFI